jgi:hypothetical protein
MKSVKGYVSDPESEKMRPERLVHWKWKAPLIHSWEESKERKEVAGVRPQVMMEALAIPSGSPGSNNDSSSPSKETGKSNHPIHLHTP